VGPIAMGFQTIIGSRHYLESILVAAAVVTV